MLPYLSAGAYLFASALRNGESWMIFGLLTSVWARALVLSLFWLSLASSTARFFASKCSLDKISVFAW